MKINPRLIIHLQRFSEISWRIAKAIFSRLSEPLPLMIIAMRDDQWKLAQISLDFGYQLPVICTPYELLGD